METITIILSIILLVFGVLQIILFFKMWRMCDNIAKIRKEGIITGAENYIEKAELQTYLGNKDKAKELYSCAEFRYKNKEQYYDSEGTDYTGKRLSELKQIIEKLSK